MQIDDKLEFSRLQDWKVSRVGSIEDATSVYADLAKRVGEDRAIAHEQTGFDHCARNEARRHPVAHCQCRKLHLTAGKEAIGRDEKSIGAFTRKSGKCRVDLGSSASIEQKDFQPESGTRFP